MPRYKFEAQQLMHSSRRLKDTLTEKRNQYKLDLNRSRIPLTATYKSNQTLTGYVLQLDIELGQFPDSGWNHQDSSKNPQWKRWNPCIGTPTAKQHYSPLKIENGICLNRQDTEKYRQSTTFSCYLPLHFIRWKPWKILNHLDELAPFTWGASI